MKKVAIVDFNGSLITDDLGVKEIVENPKLLQDGKLVNSHQGNKWAIYIQDLLVAFGHYENVPTDEVEFLFEPGPEVKWDKDLCCRNILANGYSLNLWSLTRVPAEVNGVPFWLYLHYRIVNK